MADGVFEARILRAHDLKQCGRLEQRRLLSRVIVEAFDTEAALAQCLAGVMDTAPV